MGFSKSLKKAAIVLKNLPKPQQAQVISKMQPHDIRDVFAAIDSLDLTSTRQVFEALDELARDAEHLYKFMPKSKPTEPSERFHDQQQLFQEAFKNSPFAFLLNSPARTINQLLREEHPKNIALVLANLPSEIASDQIKLLEPVMRVSVVKRICQIESEDTMAEARDLAFALKLRLQKLAGFRAEAQKGISIAAQLLNLSDDSTRTEVLTKIGQSDPELESQLNRSLSRFEDISMLSDSDVKVLLKNTDTSYWAPALKSAPASVLKKISRNMHAKAAQVLDQEIQFMGPVSPSESKNAQHKILGIYFNLAKSNVIGPLSEAN